MALPTAAGALLQTQLLTQQFQFYLGAGSSNAILSECEYDTVRSDHCKASPGEVANGGGWRGIEDKWHLAFDCDSKLDAHTALSLPGDSSTMPGFCNDVDHLHLHGEDRDPNPPPVPLPAPINSQWPEPELQEQRRQRRQQDQQELVRDWADDDNLDDHEEAARPPELKAPRASPCMTKGHCSCFSADLLKTCCRIETAIALSIRQQVQSVLMLGSVGPSGHQRTKQRKNKQHKTNK